MPIILEIPVRNPKPELALSLILKKHNIENFGSFGLWNIIISIGKDSLWNKRLLRGKIDTGATISLFPKKIALELEFKDGIPYEFYGVVRNELCKVEVELFQIDLKLRDVKGQELILERVWSAFTTLEKAPVLIGYKDVLERLLIKQIPNSMTLTLQKNI